MHTSFAARGVIVPLLTPLASDGAQVDEEALRAHVAWLIAKGVHGLMPCGTTGEGPLLTHQERRHVLEVVVETARHRVPVIAHVGAATTRETIDLAQHAQAVGADAVSAVTPYYFHLPDQALLDHYCRLAQAVPDLPVFLYNIPQCTGNTLSPAAVEAILARSPNVVGIKDSSGALASLSSLVGLNGGNFQVVCGSDALLLPALQAGACASVSGNANVFPEVVVGLFQAFWQGDLARARHQQALLDLARLAMGDGADLALLKAMAALRGLAMGPVRAPLPPASPQAVARCSATLQSAGLLPSGNSHEA